MSGWVRPLVVALVIPLLALGAVLASEARMEGEWIAAVEAEFGPIPGDALDELRLGVLCGQPDAGRQLGPLCDDVRLISWLKLAAVAAIALSVGLIGFSALAGVATRRKRRLMVLIFRPGLYAVLTGIVVLMALDGGLVVGGAYITEGVFTGYVHPGVLGGIGLAVALAGFGVLRAILLMTRRQPVTVHGVPLPLDAAPGLFALVDETAASVGTARPDNIIAGLEPTFFVTESDVRSSDGLHRGRTLFVSVPVCRLLDSDELRAVVGHEFGHFKGQDTEFSRRFYPIYRGASESLAAIAATARGLSAIPLLPPLQILGTFFESFATAERAVSRQRELAADLVGADAAAPEAVASSLVKLQAHAGIWVDLLTDASQAAVEGRRLDNVSALYAQRAAASGVGHVRDLERGQVAHPIDSHPPLADRLENLGLTFDDTLARAQRAVPDAASELFGDLETLEGRLTELLGGWAGEAIGLRAADEANGLSSGELTSELRDAATTDPAVARLITLFEPHRGPALARPFRPAERWIALADLRLEQHPDPRPFIPTVPMAELPEGDQLLVVDVAGNETDRARVLFARAELVPVGFSPLEDRRQGYEEHFYDWQGRLVVVRGVGKWPVEHQLAGLFVAPSSDPIVAVSGPFAADVEAARSALADRRGAEAPS